MSTRAAQPELTHKNERAQQWKEVDEMQRKPEAWHCMGWISGSPRKGKGTQRAPREHCELSTSETPALIPLTHKCSMKRH